MAGLTRIEQLVIAAILALVAAAGALHFATHPSVTTFAVTTAALAGIAWVVSFATEQLGERFGTGVTGLLQSTLGNLPEFFVVIFALRAGQRTVAETSIVGSIFANALLVLGLTIVIGALRSDGAVMRFRARLPNDTTTLLLVAVFIIVIVGIAGSQPQFSGSDLNTISIVGAVCLLTVYLCWVVPYVRADRADAQPHTSPRLPLALSVALLAIAGTAAAFVSDWFVIALEPAIHALHISQAFAGLVVVAIAGNAVENATALVLARKGQHDLALSVVKNSVSQIAVFLFPLLILVSLLVSTHLTFAMAPLYIGALALTAITVWQVCGDGAATVFEGVALIAIYVILATATLFE